MAISNNPTTFDWVSFKEKNPELWNQTEEDRRKKQEAARQQAALENINIPTSSEPANDPIAQQIQKTSPYDSWAKESNNYDDDPVGRLLHENQTRENNLNNERKKSYENYNKDEEFSLNDLDDDSTYQKVAMRYLKSIGSNENIYENLRDAKYSIGDAAMLAYRSGKYDEQTKADYKYLKELFDKADTGGAEHVLQATKDIAVDLIFDLPNLLAVPFIISSGGAVGLGLSAAAKFGATQAFRQASKKAGQEKRIKNCQYRYD